MNEVANLIPAAFAGGLIGTIFFGGLWWTVRNGMTSRYAALWFTVSLLVRLCITLGGFYLVGRDDWRRLLACLVGFVIARIVVTRWTGLRVPQNAVAPHHATSSEIHNAS